MAQVELHPDVRKFGPEVQAILQQLTPSQIAYFNVLYGKRSKVALATFWAALFGFDYFYLERYALGFLKLLLAIGSIGLLLLGALDLAAFFLPIYAIWWLIDIGTCGPRTRAVNERIALEVAKQVKDLVDPNAPLPQITGRQDNLLLAVLAAIAFFLLAFAVALMVR
jgi:hypothetical protein